MHGSIHLRPSQRKTLVENFRNAATHEERLRCHLLLLLADGWSWSLITAVLFTSSSTIIRWRRRFLAQGLDGILGNGARRRPSRFGSFWLGLVFRWVPTQTPRDFAFYRSRWTCGTIVVLMWEDHGVHVSRETVRRWLHQKDLVYWRPRPVLGPKDPQRSAKLRKIRALLRGLPKDQIAVFQDEVDINTNPKIGSMWMLKGLQAEVWTPGTNSKRYLAGSMNWRNGEVILTEGRKRNADLFLAHLDELRRRYWRYRVIHVICDNAVFHRPDRCRKVRKYLQRWGHRVQLHFLPAYASETNPIERVWWHWHEEITRNHRSQDIEELLHLVLDWLNGGSSFQMVASVLGQRHCYFSATCVPKLYQTGRKNGVRSFGFAITSYPV